MKRISHSSLFLEEPNNHLTKTQTLIEELNTTGIRYCHWKSNFSLAKSVAGQTDIDLLIHPQDACLFRAILSQLCFRPAIQKDSVPFPSTEHYFALDEESGVLLHVHAYFRVITGESLSKNYRFPIEEMLLQNTREENFIRVPVKSAELVVFTLRMMLKHTSLVELVLLSRDWPGVKQEIRWLLQDKPIDETLKLVESWLPSINPALFAECITALESPEPIFRRIILGLRLRSRLKIYARQSPFRAWVSGISKFMLMLVQRLDRSRKGLIPTSGGATIAFVGPEATGKSTLIAEMRHWLGEHYSVDQIHAGKPKSTILSFIPNVIVPALRFLLPGYRSGQVEIQYTSSGETEKSQEAFPLIFAIRCVLLAYDRRALLTHAFAEAANGNIILCDRYPSLSCGAPDSPQLAQLPVSQARHPIRYLLAQLEKQLYQEIPAPDLIISLSVPVDVAILRNKTRGKTEPEDYVRRRHAQSANLDFGKTPVEKINTGQTLERTILEAKKAIWRAL